MNSERYFTALKVSSSGSGSYYTTSTSVVAVTNLTVTTDTPGRPVWVGLQADGSNPSFIGAENASTDIQCYYYFYRDATLVGEGQWFRTFVSNPTRLRMPSSSLWVIDNPAAGHYVYTLKVNVAAASTTLYVYYAKLAVLQL